MIQIRVHLHRLRNNAGNKNTLSGTTKRDFKYFPMDINKGRKWYLSYDLPVSCSHRAYRKNLSILSEAYNITATADTGVWKLSDGAVFCWRQYQVVTIFLLTDIWNLGEVLLPPVIIAQWKSWKSARPWNLPRLFFIHAIKRPLQFWSGCHSCRSY
jgi:hypothetical protein